MDRSVAQAAFWFRYCRSLLTDICGLHIVNDILKRQPEVPILLITGHGGPQVFAEARRLGAVGVLTKSFQPEEFSHRWPRR